MQLIKAEFKKYDFIEIWLDYIEDLDKTFLHKLISSYSTKLIFVSRRDKLKAPELSFKKRMEVLNCCINEFRKIKEKAIIDFDISRQRKEIAHLKKGSFKLLSSYHDYEKTPSDHELYGILNSMSHYSPYIYKLATYCKNETDALRLLSLGIKLKKEKKKYIVLGMGDCGKITRIFGTLWGAEMVFAPRETAKGTAPGQLTKIQIEKIFKLID